MERVVEQSTDARESWSMRSSRGEAGQWEIVEDFMISQLTQRHKRQGDTPDPSSNTRTWIYGPRCSHPCATMQVIYIRFIIGLIVVVKIAYRYLSCGILLIAYAAGNVESLWFRDVVPLHIETTEQQDQHHRRTVLQLAKTRGVG